MPNKVQSTNVSICAEEGRAWTNWMLFNSLPVNLKENEIAGLWTPSSFGECLNGAVQAGSPVICEEESMESSSNLIITPGPGNFDHEDAGTKDNEDSEKNVANHQSFGGKPKRKHRKKSKKKGREQFGNQRGKEHRKGSQSQRPTESEQPVPEQINNAVGSAQQRINQPSKNGHGEDSDSEEENRVRPDCYSGHYAGIMNEEMEVSNEEEIMEEQTSQAEEKSETIGYGREEEESPMVVDNGPPPWDPKCDTEGIARIVKAMENEVSGPFLTFAKQITRLCVHVSYRERCDNCQETLCPKVRGFLEHVKMRHGECRLCSMVDLGLFLHAVECCQGECPVLNCSYWKNWLASRNDRRCNKGKVIHSTTTLFKENSFVYEDNDYTFLEKASLGKGAFGHAWRVWFYSPVHQREADIVLKEARYDLTEEAKIHGAIRQNHPNLLGAMAVIKLHTPRIVLGKPKPIHGYILMERGERSLCGLKKEYQEVGERGLLPRDALFYFYQVLEALRYLHDKGIVHKDVKDMNVLLFNGGQLAKLSDWDSAIFVRDEMEFQRTSSLPRKGTLGFCASEVYNQSCHRFPADIFSAAVMLLETCYGGMYPRIKDVTDEWVTRRKDAIQVLKNEHTEIGNLIEKCLSEDPVERPTAYDLVNNSLLKFEQNFKTRARVVGTGASADHNVEQQEFRYLADISGEGGEAVRQRFMEIKDKPPEYVLRMMDGLDKVLPSENLPQSSQWEGIVTETSENETGSVEAMDTS